MGWSFNCDPSFNRDAAIARIKAPGYLSPGYTMQRVMPVGNHIWYLYQTPEGRKTIGLTLIAGGGRGYGWGEKGVSEDMGPCELDCPLSLLDAAHAPESRWAYEWRQQVRAWHAARAVRKGALKEGAAIRYGDATFTLLAKLEGRRGWRAKSSDGKTYRMSVRQVAQSQVL